MTDTTTQTAPEGWRDIQGGPDAIPGLDRIHLRLEIGKAVRAMEVARKAAFADQELEAEITAKHREWRRLIDQANAAKDAYDEALKGGDQLAAERYTVLRLQDETPGLMLMSDEHVPNHHPRVICCAITGLAIFEGDDVIGREDYGFVALAAALRPQDGVPSLGPAPKDVD